MDIIQYKNFQIDFKMKMKNKKISKKLERARENSGSTIKTF